MPGNFGKPRPALVIQSDQFHAQTTVTVLLVSSTLIDTPLFRVGVFGDCQVAVFQMQCGQWLTGPQRLKTITNANSRVSRFHEFGGWSTAVRRLWQGARC